MNSLEKMDATLRRLKQVGIEIVGEKLEVDYSTKRQTREQAEREVKRQQYWDDLRAKELEQLRKTLEATP